MKFIVYSPIDENSIREKLGQPEYSYHFVAKGFQLALAELGSIELIQDPTTEVDPIFARCTERGEECVFLSFSPPHKTVVDLECPTVPVIAWEYSTIPNEALDDDPRSDWRFVLSKVGRAITLSSYAERAIKGAMGPTFPVRSISVPVVQPLSHAVKTPHTAGSDVELTVRGTLWDSATMNLSVDLLATPVRPSQEAPASSQTERGASTQLAGRVFKAIGSSMNAPWSSWVASQVERLREAPFVDRSSKVRVSAQQRVKVSGVVYTSVISPADGRKNWADMVSAFCWAFRDTEDATLVLKMVHKESKPYRDLLVLLLSRLSPFRCRVVTFHGYLEDEEYEALIGSTTYYVNTSSCEGLCLPLMEFMVRGKPAIAPTHTAMTDYLDDSVAFIVQSSLEYSAWPHDPRRLFRTMRYRLDWETVLEGFRESYRLAKTRPEEYSAMAMRARSRMQDYCSVAAIKEQLRGFFEQTKEFVSASTDEQPTSNVADCLARDQK